MSLYQHKLKRDIQYYQNSIVRCKSYINFLNRDIEENNYISKQAYLNQIREYSLIINSLKARLKRAKRLIH